MGSKHFPTAASISPTVLQGDDQIEMQPEQGAMVGPDAAVQRFDQLVMLASGGALGEVGQPVRVALALDDGAEHGPAGHAQHPPTARCRA